MDSVDSIADSIALSLDFLDDDDEDSTVNFPIAAVLSQHQWKIGQRVLIRDEHEDSDWKSGTITQTFPCVEASPDGWDESYEWQHMQVHS